MIKPGLGEGSNSNCPLSNLKLQHTAGGVTGGLVKGGLDLSSELEGVKLIRFKQKKDTSLPGHSEAE